MSPLLRLASVQQRTGLSRTQLYMRQVAGLMVQSVKISPRAAAIPAAEVDAVMAAQTGGATDDQIRALVKSLHDKRKAAADAVLAGV
jgi:prophage regulatory protein